MIPFPLKKVLPICQKVTGFLKTKEDREDARGITRNEG